MGTYSKGILGSFTGKVGTVIGSSWNGIDYMRSLPRRSNKAPTDSQLEQRIKLTLAVGFLKPVSALVNFGFKSSAVKQTGFNVATSLLVKNAITGVYPDYEIDYSKVLISKGDLTGPWDVAVTSADPAAIAVDWSDNSGSGTAGSTDKLVLMVYNPAQSQYVYIKDGAARNAATETLAVPADFTGDTVHVWVAFVSADKKAVSTSIYAGTVVVA